MKKISLFVSITTAAVLLASTTALSGSRADDDNSSTSQQLMQLEREWAQAMASNDAATIDRIEAPDYSYVLGELMGDKQGDLAEAKAQAFSGTAELGEMKTRIYGDTALIMGKVSLRQAKYKGSDISGDYSFLDVFVKRGGNWQAVASHAHRVHNNT